MTSLVSFLLLSTAMANATTRDWKFSVATSVTRCFDTKDVKVFCENDSLPGKSTKISEELHIKATDFMFRKVSYGYGMMIEGDQCKQDLKRIKKLIKDTNEACITGDGEMQFKTGEYYSRWIGLETRKGEVLR